MTEVDVNKALNAAKALIEAFAAQTSEPYGWLMLSDDVKAWKPSTPVASFDEAKAILAKIEAGRKDLKVATQVVGVLSTIVGALKGI